MKEVNKMKLTNSFKWTSRDGLKAITNDNINLGEMVDKDITVRAAAVYADVDAYGEIKPVAYIKDSADNIYATVSKTAAQAIDFIIAVMKEERMNAMQVHVIEKTAGSGNKFLTFTF